jgi:hypothetical protein
MRITARQACLVAAALVLSGCFSSQEELIGYWGAERPIEEGVWAHWPTNPDGTEWEFETWRGEVSLERRRYVSDDENFPHEGTRFRALGPEVYITQWTRADGVGYGVAWLYEDGAVLSYHQPDCADLPEEARIETGVSPDGEGFCLIADLDQLDAVMRAYLAALGQEIRVDGVYRRVG